MADTISFSIPEFSTYIGRILPLLDEQQRRIVIGGMVAMAGRGGLKRISQITGISQPTLIKGRNECEALSAAEPQGREACVDSNRIRKEGGGRKSVTDHHSEIESALTQLLDGHVIGNPENPLCWTTKSTYTLSKLLADQGMKASPNTVAKLLRNAGFSLQQNRKYVEKAAASPDRDEQFRYINEKCKTFWRDGCPVISVDTKKKELVGNYKNNGAEYRPTKEPRKVNGHDFEGPGGKVAPYGVFDIQANEGFVNVGLSADTAEFATASIRRWWEEMGKVRYSSARKLMITADCGGSNGYRTRLWKVCLQRLANETNLEIHVSHFPPGTSKWNKIEHLLFAQISRCWRGQPLESLEVIVSLIAATTTDTGLSVQCAIDDNEYQRGIAVSDEEMAVVNLEKSSWRGDWNYIIRPQEHQ